MELERVLHDNPHKKLLVRALELKHTNRVDSLLDAFLTELLLTGRTLSTLSPGLLARDAISLQCLLLLKSIWLSGFIGSKIGGTRVVYSFASTLGLRVAAILKSE